MEYVDNALDSAERWYSEEENKYTKPIEVIVNISGKKPSEGEVSILDNCAGIDDLKNLVQSIGNSNKKAQAWTNGQFGFGFYAFLEACSVAHVTTKREGEDAEYIPVEGEKFNTEKIQDVYFVNPKRENNFPYESGTKIRLNKFNKDSWKAIDTEKLRAEIETHFDLLLRRRNLTVKVIGGEEGYVCQPFDYEGLEGEEYKDQLKDLKIIDNRRRIPTTYIRKENPPYIFLKITQGRVVNRAPVFVSKGRRIGAVKDIKAFRSNHKSDIWDHPNITGYVDTKGLLDPTIARTEFRNTSESKALFGALLELEPLILDVLKNINSQQEEKHYNKLEEKLNSVLSNLAKDDILKFRTEYLQGNDDNLQKGGLGTALDAEGQANKDDTETDADNGEGVGDVGEDGVDLSEEQGGHPGGSEGENASTDPAADSPFKGQPRKKSGFNIQIVSREPDVDEETGEMLRSQLIGGDIRIYRKHPEFKKRVREARDGGKKITQRLITYLAGEITVHYKDKFYEKHEQPEYNKRMFESIVEFMYRFENALSDYEGKNLADLNE